VPSFKTRGDYLAVITLAASYIVKSAIENVEAVGGPRGFMGMGKLVMGMGKLVSLPWMLIWIFIGVVFTLWILRRFVYSTYGKGIMAIHQDEVAAEIMSVNTNRMKLIAFMLSSGLAGLAGGLYAYLIGFINPGAFTILRSTECLVMVYLGGMGSLSGSVLSAVVFALLMEFLKPLEQIKWVVIPLLLILLMQFRPEGIMGNRELSDVFPGLKRFYRFK
jgi:branched-chain amino acid transport system permease protein